MRLTRVLRLFAGPLVLTAFVVASLPSLAVDDQPTGGRVPTVTRLVKLFLEKEASLGAAVRNADAIALGSLLTDDFELRTGARAASPIPRADWMRELLRTRDAGGEISRMAVHDFGVVAIASFTQDAAGGPVFIVDVWRGQGSDWKLAVRYASPAGSPAFAIPGGSASEPEIPKKY
ncbi:MAG TPA: hypothetical protein VGK75_16980 [Casimicrobiaceae bacterium]|jgi:hypothetical protein